MALITAGLIIRSISFFHILLAFFFLTSPITIANQTLVQVMGEAMGLSLDRSFDRQSAPLAFLGAVFAIWGISDLASMSLPEEISMYFWGAQAPIRITVFFTYTFYSYVFSSSSPIHQSRSDGVIRSPYIPITWGEGVKNSLFFTWAFLELICWFWVFLTVREERRELALRIQMRRAKEEERL